MKCEEYALTFLCLGGHVTEPNFSAEQDCYGSSTLERESSRVREVAMVWCGGSVCLCVGCCSRSIYARVGQACGTGDTAAAADTKGDGESDRS